jgi:predicted phosphodiesterase
MANIQDVIRLVSRYGTNWKRIGIELNENPEAIRSTYRRHQSNILLQNGIRIAFCTDQHHPYQDDKARSVALQIVREFDPDIFVSGSDGIDFYAVSSFDKSPKRANKLQEEIDSWVRSEIEWIDAAPNAKRFFIIGNHEDRLRRYLWSHHEIADLRSMQLESLLEFKRLNLQLAKNNEIEVGKLLIKHGERVSNKSAYSAQAEMLTEHYEYNVMTGHTHRMGNHLVTKRTGIVQAQECGCLCSLDVDYVNRPNWQQGFALATVYQDVVSVEAITIHTINNKRRAYWRGKEFQNE